jgi:hypothetical protein
MGKFSQKMSPGRQFFSIPGLTLGPFFTFMKKVVYFLCVLCYNNHVSNTNHNMKNKSSIFLLLGLVDYEGDVVLGAYSSLKKANCALDAYKAKVDADRVNNRYENTAYDDYVINECEVNAEV